MRLEWARGSSRARLRKLAAASSAGYDYDYLCDHDEAGALDGAAVVAGVRRRKKGWVIRLTPEQSAPWGPHKFGPFKTVDDARRFAEVLVKMNQHKEDWE